MNLPFFTKKPQNGAKPKPKLQSSTAKATKIQIKAPPMRFILPKSKYLEIISDDIKKLVGKDVESIKKKSEYRDFMEEHFGRDK